MINDLKALSEWKTHLTIEINFMSSKDNNLTCIMHSKSDSKEIMIDNETNEIIQELFDSFLKRYQTSSEDSNFYLTVLICCIISVIQ